jgi:hypothetical protein
MTFFNVLYLQYFLRTDGSSPEQSSPQESSSTANNANNGNRSQLKLQTQHIANGPLQPQQHPMFTQYIGYSTPQQQQTAVQKNYAASIAAANGTAAGNHLAQFGMVKTRKQRNLLENMLIIDNSVLSCYLGAM